MSVEDEVHQASDRFYSIMNRAINGDATVLELPDVCSQGDDMTVMSEMGGRQIGWPEILAMWEAGMSAVSSGSVETRDLRVTSLGRDAAYTTGTVNASVTIGEMPLTFSARCTDIYRRENDGWKLVHHHLDALPDAAGFQNALEAES